jgi:hypothetical protein
VKLTEENIPAIIEAIRTDKHLGRGTCSSVDETMTDEELAEDVRATARNYPKMTLAGYLKDLKDVEKIFWERQGIDWPSGKPFEE